MAKATKRVTPAMIKAQKKRLKVLDQIADKLERDERRAYDKAAPPQAESRACEDVG